MGKYSINGSPEFDALVDRHMQRIADEAWSSSYSRTWKALILTGSYGRGEGTPMMDRNGNPVPLDGYEFVLVTGKTNPLIRDAARILSERMTAGLGLPIRIHSLLKSGISTARGSLHTYKLKNGCRVIRGDEKILGRLPDFPAERIPLSDGTRRLMQHGGLLLDIKQRLSSGQALTSEERRQFIGYIFETNLALGEALLLMKKAYSTSCLDNKEQLQSMEFPGLYDARGIVSAYSQVVELRTSGNFRPYETANLHLWADETIQHFRNVFLWYERRRLNRKFSTVKRYAHAFPNLGNEGAPLKNMMRNLRAFGIMGLKDPFVHPRLRLYAATLLLLDDPVDSDELRWMFHTRLGRFDGICSLFSRLQKHYQ